MNTKRLLGRALGVFFLFLAIATTPAATLQVLQGHVPPAVPHLQPQGPLPATNHLNLAITLPLRNKAALSILLNQIYDPSSPQYRHYLTPAEFTEKFGPSKDDYQAVIAFAKKNGLRVTAAYSNRMLVDVNGSVADIEHALHLKMNVYRHPTEPRTFYAPSAEPSLDLSVAVLHIGGLDNYALPRPNLVAKSLGTGQNIPSPAYGSGPQGNYMGKDFRAAYVPNSSLNGSGQTVGLLEFDGFSASDIKYYENAAGLPNVPLQTVLIDNATAGPEGSQADIEVALDMEVAISMATNLSNLIVYQALGGTPFEDILNQMAADDQVSQFSCSWYINGGTAQSAADQIWMEMAAQGQSFFNASGDHCAWVGLIYFPGDSPYITQVGGTTLTTSGPGGAWASETVWNWGIEHGSQYNGVGSGGGISTQYPIPPWQTNISMAASQGSTNMRNTPDVAMTADNVYVRVDNGDYSVGGTSCAAPLWAGFAALVNQQAVATGKAPIGLINAAVDAIGTGPNYTSDFHDITTGNNTWSGSPTKFYAVSGYDLCTGWGTPAGQNLINALANPEALIITPATGFNSTGGAGGPFTVTSDTLSLTNFGTNTLTWTLSNTSVWLNVSSDEGVLMPGNPPATVTVSLNNAASNLVVGTYTATLWFTNLNDNVGQGRQFTLNIIPPPSITSQPANQAVIQGTMAMFSVSASGGLPLSYQWQFDGTNLSDGGNLSGSMTTNLVVSDVSTNDVGNYSVTVTNLAGVAVSSNASLTIIPSPPIIVTQPANESAVAGQTVTFNVSLIGTTPFSYQWNFDGTNINNATNCSLTLTNIQLTQAGAYAVTVTNALGAAISSNATLNVFLVPVITSISPSAGAIGTAVNVYGLNFSPVAASNIVYFGAVQAAVSSASATNLVVSVPPGATFAPVTETVNGLTAYSQTPFLPRFTGAGLFTNSSLGSQLVLTATNGPGDIVIADLDGDGKPDLAVSCNGTILIYRNISTNGTLSANSFAPPVALPVGTGAENTMVAADLTGDGKLDLVCLDENGTNLVMVLKNLCTPGNITSNSFAPPVTFATGNVPQSVAVEDLDGDGKPELVVANHGDSTLGVFLNTSTPGVLTTSSFASMVTFPTGAYPQRLKIADLDGDGKPDLISVGANYNGNTPSLSVLRNLSTPGNLAFATNVDFAGPTTTYSLAIGDIDGDGKPDVLVGSQPDGEAVSVYRNLSTPGSFTTNSLAAAVNFPAGAWVNDLALGDMNGDGKLDVIAACQISSQIEVFINQSTPGVITNTSLASPLIFGSGYNPNGVAVGDLDGDGRPDIAMANDYDSTVSLFQNFASFGQSPTITAQPTNQTVAAGRNATFSITAGGATPLVYQWFFNGTNVLSGATNTMLTLTNVQSANAGFYSVLVTNAFGSTNSSNALLVVTVDHFAWTTIPSPRFLNTPFTVEVIAQNATNGVFTSYSGTVFLSSTNGLPVAPTTSGNFFRGAWIGTVTLSQTVTNLVLSADDGSGHTGLANPINILNLPQLITSSSGGTLYISWPTSPSSFVLETSTNLMPGNWVRVSSSPLQFGGEYVMPIALPGTNACAFYRLFFTGP